MVESSGGFDMSAVTKQKSAIMAKVQDESKDPMTISEKVKPGGDGADSYKERIESKSYTNQTEPIGVLKEFNKQMGIGSIFEGQA